MRRLFYFLIIAFCLGWIANIAFAQFSLSYFEYPLGKSSEEVSSPSDFVDESSINIYRDLVEIKIADSYLVKYTDTNSMDPVIDENSNGIEIPYNSQELNEGDIISYRIGNTVLVHRILEIEYDSSGKYFLMKGDNSETPHKIRESQIKGILIGIIY